MALLQEPVQPAADGVGGGLLPHRGPQGDPRHRQHGGALHLAALHPGRPLQPRRRTSAGDGEQQGHGAAQARGRRTPTTRQHRRRRPTQWFRHALAHRRIAAAKSGARRPRPTLRRRHDPGGLPRPERQGPVRGTGRDDRRIAAGGKAARCRHPHRFGQRARRQQSAVHGHERGLRLRARGRHRHRQSHLLRHHRQPPHQHRPRAHRVRNRRQQRELVADPLCRDHGARRAAHQRLYQGRLDGGVSVRALRRRGTHARDAADDRDIDAGQGCGRTVQAKGGGQTPRRDPELRCDGCALHRQDRHAHTGPYRARTPHRRHGPQER